MNHKSSFPWRAFLKSVAAIAVPAYQTYVNKSQHNIMNASIDAVRLSVEQQIHAGVPLQQINFGDEVAAAANLPDKGYQRYWQSLSVEEGIIYAVYSTDNKVPQAARGQHLEVVPEVDENGAVEWYCESPVADDYLPEVCFEPEMAVTQ